jgi:hypothetical protein
MVLNPRASPGPFFRPKGRGIKPLLLVRRSGTRRRIKDLLIGNTTNAIKLVFIENYPEYPTEPGQSSANSVGIITAKSRHQPFKYLLIFNSVMV